MAAGTAPPDSRPGPTPTPTPCHLSRVPLVDQLMERTLAMAVADCAGILAFTALAVLLGQKILNWCESQVSTITSSRVTACGQPWLGRAPVGSFAAA